MKKYLVLGILLLTLLIAPAVTKAESIAELQAMIDQLTARLTAMQNGTTQTCYVFARNLKIGDNGQDVVKLKSALSLAGFTSFAMDTGEFDEQVASAVVGFQEKYASEILTPSGLTRGTGYVGPSTRAKLNALCVGVPAVVASSTDPVPHRMCQNYSRDLTIGSTGDDVRTLQQFLLSKGVFSGSVTGYFGPMTKNALTQYQASAGIVPADGYFDSITRANLNAVSCGDNPSRSSITITSPNRGESWPLGVARTIRINRSMHQSEGSANFWLVDTSGVRKGIVSCHVSVGESGFRWTVGNLVSGCGTDFSSSEASVGQYKLKLITDNSSQTVLAESGYFTITSGAQACIGEGGYTNGTVAPEYATYCCSGLTPQFPNDGTVGGGGRCVKNVTPSITVTSPNGGESYKIGDTLPVSWRSTGLTDNSRVGDLYFHLVYPNGQLCLLGSTSKNKTSINFTIPSTICSDERSLVAGNYKVQVFAEDLVGGKDWLAKDTSDNYFSITSSQTQTPSITVLSPNGGESYGPNDTIRVRYQANTDISAVRVLKSGVAVSKDISLQPPYLGYVDIPVKDLIPATSGLNGSDFKVRVVGAKEAYYDESDSYFAITSNTPPPVVNPKTVTYKFKVTNILNGQSISGATVKITGNEANQTLTTGSDGITTLGINLGVDKNYDIAVSAPGYFSNSTNVVPPINSYDTAMTYVSLRPSGETTVTPPTPTNTYVTYKFKVWDPSNQPIVGAKVAISGSGANQTLTTGADGITTVGINLGVDKNYNISVSASGYFDNSTTVVPPINSYDTAMTVISLQKSAETTVDRTTTPTVLNFVASDSTYDDKVYMSWTNAGSIALYDIYRASSFSGPWTNVIKWRNEAPNYSDTTGVPGVTYYYRVCAVNKNNTELFSCSNPDQGAKRFSVIQGPNALSQMANVLQSLQGILNSLKK